MEASSGTAVGRPPAMRYRTRLRAAWALVAVTSVLVVTAFALDVHTGSYRQLLYLAIAELLSLLGILLTTRRPEQRISWGVAATALAWAVGGGAYAYAVEALVADPGSLPGGLAAAWLDNWLWLPTLLLPVGLLLLVVPDGQLLSRRWRTVAAALVGGTTVASAGLSGAATFDLGAAEPIDNPLALDTTAAHVVGAVGYAAVAGAVVASLFSFVLRYRRSAGEQRQQLRWIGGSLGVAACVGGLGALSWGVLPYAYVLYAIALLVLPIGTAVAVLRYRLYEIDLVVNRAIVYGAMTVCVVASYVLVVGLAGATLSDRGSLLLSLAVTGVVAVCFQPLRERVQRFVNKLMYGERDDPYAAFARLGRRLESSLGADDVLLAAVETIGQTLRLRHVALMIVGSDDVVVAYGTPAPVSLRSPLVHHGVTVGELLVAARAGESLREGDRRLIADLAPQVAAAAHAVGLAHELRAARRRLVELREEERRRIRRDLHDGLGPALAGLTFTLDAVHNLAGSDLERARSLLASATEQTQTMIAEVRRLIYGLRPPALDELGLVGSLRSVVSREVVRTTAVAVEMPEALPPLHPAVEVAVYRIVQEALTNVARHARARSCRLHLSVEPDALVVEIADDGQGFAKGVAGAGLHTMRERAVELGGSCQITSTPGVGTIVSARLPRHAPVENAE
jgi:signal transduction histidine kinase